MSSSSIEGTPLLVDESLSGSGTQINAQAQAIVDELNTLYNQLQPLVESWTGQAASYFDPLMQEWNTAATGLFGTASEGGILGEIAAAMNVSWNNYSMAESANASTWSSST